MTEQPRSSNCFLCGRDNLHGLKLTWHSDFDKMQVWTEAEIAEHFNGFDGIVHGGIIAALLDETACRAVALQEKELYFLDPSFVTGGIDIKYHHPTPTCTPIRVISWIKKSTPKYYVNEAKIELLDGTVTATAKALMIRIDKEFKNKHFKSSKSPYQ